MTFKSYLTLKAPIIINIFKATLENLRISGIDINALRKELSESRKLLVSSGPKGFDDSLYIFSSKVKLLLNLDKKSNSFNLISFYFNTISTRSTALKSAANLLIPDDIGVIIPNYPEKNSYYDKGQLVNNNKRLDEIKALVKSEESGKILLDDIRAFTNERANLYEKQKSKIDESKNTISKELEEMLDQTSEIIDAYEEFEKNKVINNDWVTYKTIRPIKAGDKAHYILETEELDHNLYSINTPIKLTDKYDNVLIATINNYLSQDNENNLNILEITLQDEVDSNILNSTNGSFSPYLTSTISKAQRRAVEDIRLGRTKAKYIDTAIAQGKPKDYKNTNLDKFKRENKKRQRKFNDSQILAISNGIDSEDIYLVMGPPGTGKTSVIVEWVKYFAKEGKRVLVSSQNNAAVDNVLEKLTENNEINILRMGKDQKISSTILPFTLSEKTKFLEENLKTSTEKTIAKLEKLEIKVNDLITHFKEFNKLNKKQISLEEQFNSTVNSRLLPLVNKLDRKITDYNQVQLELDKSQERIEKVYQAVNYPENTNGFQKFLQTFVKGLNPKNLDELYKNYEQLDYHETTLITDINKLQSQLEILLNQLERQYDSVLQLKCHSINLKDHLRKLFNFNNDFNLFENVDLLFNSDTNQRTNYISSELKRLKSLKTVYQSWNEIIKEGQSLDLNNIILDSSNVVGSTCIGINSQQEFKKLDFDVSIIDEAGQIQIQNALIPMTASNKLIMLGDYNQIPPVVENELRESFISNNCSTKFLDNSLFEIIYKKIGPKNKSMLDTQYRMPSSIADTVSKVFYNGKYKSSPQKQKASSCCVIPNFKKPYIFIDTADSQTRFENGKGIKGFENKYEADVICNLVGKILEEENINPEEIGIISAYKEQINTIRRELNNRKIVTKRQQIEAMVNTLDSFQGQERDLILYSFVRSNRKAKPTDRRIGFLKEIRRLNVAMTRAKRALILIGDAAYLSNCHYQEYDKEGNLIPETDEQPFSRLISQILKDVTKNGTYVKSKGI